MKELNLQTMREEYFNRNCDKTVKSAFHYMALMGFISKDTWTKFWNEVADWVYNLKKMVYSQ